MNEEIKKWWNKAKDDLNSAKHSFESKDYGWCCFQIQQSVEKALKTLLIQEKGEFPKIHDLVKLARIINADQEIVEICSTIAPVYTDTRYPDIDSENVYGKKLTQNLIKSGEKILKWVEKKLNF